MLVETALALAGPGSVLASRPTGVAHVVPAGPLTPAGDVPRRRRPVCRARTRRLHVVAAPPSWSSLLPPEANRLPRLCARCSTCLASRRRRTPIGGGGLSQAARQVEQLPRSRDEYLETFAGVTPADLYVAVQLAADADEVSAVGHLSLLLFGHPECTRPTSFPSSRTRAPLHDVITRRRREWPHPDITARAEAAEAHSEHATQIRIARAQELKAARDRQRAPRLNPTGAPL